MSRSSLALLGVAVLAVVTAVLPFDPTAGVDPALAGAGPTWSRPLGSDAVGRDVLVRLLFSTQAFAWPGLVALATSLGLGATAGGVAGAVGGWGAAALEAPAAIAGAAPRFILIVLLIAIFGANTTGFGLFVGLAFAPAAFDAVRTETAQLRASGWLAATRMQGRGWLSLVVVDLLAGACRWRLAALAVRCLVFTMVVETTLSFLGDLGVQEPTPSWGNMLALGDGRFDRNPLSWLAPLAAIWLTAAAGLRVSARWTART